MIFLNKNESPFDFPDSFKKEVCSELLLKNWNRYTEINFLEEKLANKLSLHPKNVLITSGNMNAIDIFFNYILEKEDFIQLEPSYFRYQNYVAQAKLLPIMVPYVSDQHYENLLNTIVKYPNYPVLICNPNNPTGLYISMDKLNKLARHTASLIFVDATYYFYSDESFERAYKISEPAKNMILAFSLSKAFSSAGIRLGLLVGDELILNKIRSKILPFTNYFSSISLNKLLDDKWWDWAISNLKKIHGNKKKLIKNINNIKNVIPRNTQTNFVLVKGKSNRETEDLHDYLLKKSIQTKIIGIYDELYVRVTVGNAHECNFLTAIFKSWDEQ